MECSTENSIRRAQTLKYTPWIPTKYKMKLSKLNISKNEQTDESYKYIYAAMIANPLIQILIDLPLKKIAMLKEKPANYDSSSDEGEANPQMVAPS